MTRRQVARILSLDVDGRGFHKVAERGPVVRGLQQRHGVLALAVRGGGLVHSSATASVAQAARVKARMVEELGQKVNVESETEHAFPGHSRLARLKGFPGLTEAKVDRSRHPARAAGEGRLEDDFLRLLPAEEAPLSRPREPPGIGPFSAELGLLRGAGAPDAGAYGLDESMGEERRRRWAGPGLPCTCVPR